MKQMSSSGRRRFAALAGILSLSIAGDALAGGLTLHTRGVRPTARGGAFVAGADDLGALWFNPAGIAHTAGNKSFLFDLAYVEQDIDYTRIDSGGNEQPTVSNSAPGLPIPSIGVGMPLGKRTTVAFGVYAPYAGLAKFPDDGAQRYSSIDLSESLLAVISAGIAINVSPKLRLGATVQNMFFALSSTVVMAACPGETVCAPEDPQWDALVKLTQVDYFSPSLSGGVQFDPHKLVTMGASLQLPFFIGGNGEVETKLPDSGFYNGAHVEGDTAEVSFTMPAIIRTGVEFHPGRWNIEAALDVELWSMHKEMRIEPKDVAIVDAPGINAYELGPVIVPRKYKNSYAASFGVEGQPLRKVPVRVLAGYTYETGAAPDAYLSTLTVDGTKQVFAGGLGINIKRWRFEAMLSVASMADREVTMEDARSPQLTPIRPADDAAKVNAGTYKSSWIAAGLGVSATF